MKVKITAPDGTTIELEGTAEELEKVIPAAKPVPPLYWPFNPMTTLPGPTLPLLGTQIICSFPPKQ